MTVRILQGDCREMLRTMADESVHCVVTSPPYFGLRDYGTAKWEGGDPGCDHRAPSRFDYRLNSGLGPTGVQDQASNAGSGSVQQFRCVCGKCGARRIDSQIGLEPTPDAYVAEMVALFREVRRVLRKDGTVWLNLGDSYSGAGPSGGATTSKLKETSEAFSTRAAVVPGRREVGLKPKDLIGIPWRVAFALQADGWYLRQEIIWCLSGGTRVYARTQKGEMPMSIKDMVRLDPSTVQLWNGERWTQVLGWNRSPEPRDALEIELRSGQRIGATSAHQWPTQRGLVRTDELQPGDVIETTQLPEPAVPESPKAIPDEFGYLVGLYLADGSVDSRGRIQLAGHANELEHRLSAAGYLTDDYGAYVRGYINGNESLVVIESPVVLAMLRMYVYGDRAASKGLKSAAWRRSNQFLRHFIEGYITADGHYDAENNRYRLAFTRNDRLAGDIRTICARLGLPLRLAATTADGFGKEWPIYRGDLRLEPTQHHNARRDGEVVAVRSGKGRQFWDIGVADEPHLFALASGVLTHNSKPNPMPESVRDRCTKAHESLFLLTKSPTYFYDNEAIAEASVTIDPRRPYTSEGAKQLDGRAEWKSGQKRDGEDFTTRNRRSVWTIATQPFPEAHFATFPPELPELCIKAGTSEKGCCPQCGAPWGRVVERERVEQTGLTPKQALYRKQGLASSKSTIGRNKPWSPDEGRVFTINWQPSCSCPEHQPVPCTVLDPFAGVGTTGLVADRLQRNAILIELSESYADMARKRITGDAPLFAETAA